MNNILSKRKGRFSTVILLLLLAALPKLAHTQDTPRPEKSLTAKHILPEKEIRASAVAYSAERNARVDKVARLLDSEAARKQLAQWGIKADQAKSAISRLDNKELEYLSAQGDSVMADVQGGASLWLVAGVAAAVVLALVVILLLAGAKPPLYF